MCKSNKGMVSVPLAVGDAPIGFAVQPIVWSLCVFVVPINTPDKKIQSHTGARLGKLFALRILSSLIDLQ